MDNAVSFSIIHFSFNQGVMSDQNYYSKPYKKREQTKPPRQRIGDYQIFVAAVPTGDLAERIQKVREELGGKTAVATPPHIILAGAYWRNGDPARGARGLVERLERLASKIKPFELKVGGIQTFGERLILGVTPNNAILQARKSLLGEIGEDKHRRYRPHLTLATGLEQAALEAALAKLRESEWENGRFMASITEFHLMQRSREEANWRDVYTILLG